jgi:hypothetical protein
MKRSVRVQLFIAGGLALLALAGCGRGFLQYGERASWRHEAEVNCLKSGEVKLGTGVVRIEPIEGPGMCGVDFPLKVSMLGETPANGAAMSYADDMRPPAGIPGGYSSQPPWPPTQSRYAPPAPVQPVQVAPVESMPIQSAPYERAPVQSAPIERGTMRWVPGPQGIEQPADEPVSHYAPPGEQSYGNAPAGSPMSLDPPENNSPAPMREPSGMTRAAPPADDIPDDAVLPPGRAQPSYQRQQPAYNAPVYQAPPQRALPALGPMRGPNATAAMMPAAVSPPATLSCPLVSALDRWVSEGVQPAALHWFGTPVAEIKQIGSYSCREMVGSGTSNMSEHAFGDALDIAGFVFADGRKILVKNGWHGSPEEQGFLHDVQLYACETFSTVLAPGYNVYHYDHIHVDLMRRASGRHPCRPNAIPGEVAAAKARAVYASRHGSPAYTGSITASDKAPVAIPGADGDDADDKGPANVTGPVGAYSSPAFH